MSDAFAHGAVVAPLPDVPGDRDSVLRAADPALAAMRDFLAWGIERYVGPRLISQGRHTKPPLKVPAAVAQKITADPSPFLFANKFQFPILALYRKSEDWSEHTVAYDKSVTEFVLGYVLPPIISPEQVEEFNPLLHAIAVTVRRLLSRGDSAYPDGGVSAMLNAGVANAKLTKVSYGTFQRIEGPTDLYRAVTGSILVMEREMPVEPSGPPFNGNASVGIAVKDKDGTTVPDVSSSPVFAPPTITSISPTSGPKAGGTTVTIWGTNFREGARIFVGGVECTNVQFLDDTAVRGVSAAHGAYPSFEADVVVVNDDGQSATLSAAFTYQTP